MITTHTNQCPVNRVRRSHRNTPYEQVVDGSHPALVDPKGFDRTQALRRSRDRAAGSARDPGRPSARYMLAKLARCLRCGERMYASTSTYRRKDGTRARRYVCANSRDCTGGCDQPPLSARIVDHAVLANLEGLLLDYRGWLESMADRGAVRRRSLDAASVEAERLQIALERRESLLRERWMQAIDEGDERREQATFEALDAVRNQHATSGARLRELADERAAIESTGATGAAEVHRELLASLAGHATRGAVADVNAALREIFCGVWLDRTPRGLVLHPEPRPELSTVFAFDPATLSGRLLNITNTELEPIDALSSYAGPQIATHIPHRSAMGAGARWRQTPSRHPPSPARVAPS